MKIRLSDIGPAGLNVTDTLPLDSINSRMQEGHTSDIVFLDPPKVQLQVIRTNGGAEICGKVSARIKQPCGKCAKEIERAVDSAVKLTVLHETSQMSAARNVEGGTFDDVGVMFFRGEQLELEDTLQESLILQLSPFWHPQADAEGKCLGCGERFKSEAHSGEEPKQALSQLLKKAGIS